MLESGEIKILNMAGRSITMENKACEFLKDVLRKYDEG
jgi:hypothetical protein